jgi:hypothetical protein
MALKPVVVVDEYKVLQYPWLDGRMIESRVSPFPIPRIVLVEDGEEEGNIEGD